MPFKYFQGGGQVNFKTLVVGMTYLYVYTAYGVVITFWTGGGAPCPTEKGSLTYVLLVDHVLYLMNFATQNVFNVTTIHFLSN